MESIQTAGTDCLERCDGLIVDAFDQNKAKDNSKIENLLADYENYKFPNKSAVPFPYSLNGKIIKKKPLILTLHPRKQIQEQITLCEDFLCELYF